jgi:signal transduction histidine kinase/CheY-like chemotaxis protein
LHPEEEPEAEVQSLTEPVMVFIVLRFPLFEIMRSNESRAAAALSSIALSRIQRFRESARFSEQSERYEQKALEREYELGALVHDINNTVQDMTLLCESILEESLAEVVHGSAAPKEREEILSSQIKRIADVARCVATVVSDAKRKRELERLSDLRPREMVEVTNVLDDILAFASIRAARKRIHVEFPESSTEQLWVRVSVREHLETILRNLLNNAIAYSEPGSKIGVSVNSDADWVRINVFDNGPGLSESDRDAIFLSGFRGRSSMGMPGGLGLGLAESRRVAESAGGSLDAFSEGEGFGSTFTVVLPRQNPPVTNGECEQWSLVVDDQPALAEFYCRLSKALHLAPASASSVDEALSIVDRRGQPTFVITDIHLGASNGLELVRQLRLEFGNALPILVVSGLTDESVAQKARAAGATDFVAKPVSRRVLFARIQSLLPSWGA